MAWRSRARVVVMLLGARSCAASGAGGGLPGGGLPGGGPPSPGVPTPETQPQHDLATAAARVMQQADKDEPPRVRLPAEDEDDAQEEPAAAVDAAPADAADEDAAEPDAEEAEESGAAASSGAVAELRRRASKLGKEGSWQEAADVYEEACALLLAEPDAAAAAEQLQACRLNRALCCIKSESWDDVVSVCSDVLGADSKCGTAYFRRGQALQAQGNSPAAAWDLQKASKLLPASKEVKRALKRSRRAVLASAPDVTPLEPYGGGAGGAGGLDAMMQQMLSGAGGDGKGMPDFASLLGGLGGAGGADGGLASLLGGLGGAGGDGDGGLASLLGSMGGSKGASGGGGGGLESLLGSLGPKGGALGYVGKALTLKRRADAVWKSVKGWLPVLFWAVLFLLWYKQVSGWLQLRLLGTTS